MNTRTTTIRLWWVECAAAHCLERSPWLSEDVTAWETEQEAVDYAVDGGWVPTPRGELYCPNHGRQLCVTCDRWIGDEFASWVVCALCRSVGHVVPDDYVVEAEIVDGCDCSVRRVAAADVDADLDTWPDEPTDVLEQVARDILDDESKPWRGLLVAAAITVLMALIVAAVVWAVT